MRLFHGTQALPLQIVNSFLLYRAIGVLSDSFKHDGMSAVTSFMEAQLKGTVLLRKARHFDSEIVLLGVSYCRLFPVEERFLVNDDSLYGPVDEGEQAEFLQRLLLVVNCHTANSAPVDLAGRIAWLALLDGTVVELKVFAAVKGVCFAFARLVYLNRPSWLRTEDECGRLY